MSDESKIIGLEQILPDMYYQKINLIHMYTIEIKKEYANEAILVTKSHIDNQLRDNYNHVKRCRKSQNDNIEILIGPSKDIPTALLNDLRKINRTETIPIRQISVSKYAPLTRQQYSEWSQYWPLYFKKPAYVSNNSCLTDLEIKKAIYFLNCAIEIGQKYGTCKSGCVLTYKDVIIASSGDNTKNHPLQHSAMLAIEEASYKLREVLRLKRLLQQIENIQNKNETEDSEESDVLQDIKEYAHEETNLEIIETEKHKQKKQKKEEKEENKMEKNENEGEEEKVAKENKIKKERGNSQAQKKETHWEEQEWDALEIKKRLKMYEPLTPGQYLCTNYFAYLSHEPCFMCAMALLHSRVKYVIFDQENKQNGAVYSKVKLHLVENLNHYYRVYKAKRQN